MSGRGAFIGLDIGGQSIRGLRLEGDGSVSARTSIATPGARGASAVLDAILDLVRSLAECGPVAAVGVGTPGGVAADGRIVGEAANIPGWIGTPLGAKISEAVGVPCLVRNDANLAAYAEWVVRGCRPRALLFVGMGTGIGGGYLDAGRILGGCDDRALEIGHIVVEPHGRLCACGIAGCVEAYASGPSIGRLAMDLALGRDAKAGSLGARIPGLFESDEGFIAKFEASGLAHEARSGTVLNAREVYAAYARGDPLALAVDAIIAEALARAVAAGLAFLAPELVVLGGGVITGAGHLVDEVASRVRISVYRDAWRDCRFEPALLSSDAGLLGAAFLGASCILPVGELPALASQSTDALHKRQE